MGRLATPGGGQTLCPHLPTKHRLTCLAYSIVLYIFFISTTSHIFSLHCFALTMDWIHTTRLLGSVPQQLPLCHLALTRCVYVCVCLCVCVFVCVFVCVQCVCVCMCSCVKDLHGRRASPGGGQTHFVHGEEKLPVGRD